MKQVQQIHPVISIELYRRAKAYCARRGISMGALVEAALRQYLDDSADPTLILSRLDRTGRGIEKLRRDVELLSEFQSVFVRWWFAHTPQIADSERRDAQRVASKRFEQMLDYTAKRFAAGHRLTDDLVTEKLADDEELAAFAARGESDGSGPPSK